jgi:prepilin-type N-terminal cleavage/methylation domain-containing protein
LASPARQFFMNAHRLKGNRGFTLIELMIVVGITAVSLGVVLAISPQMARYVKAQSGTEQFVAALRFARETAVGQRRNVEVRFLSVNTIQIARVEIPSGTTTVLQTIPLESKLQYYLMPSVPDTPDLFGNATAIAFGSSTTRMFTSEGTFVDQNGDELNGTVFFGIQNQPESARAVTIFGPTALVRTWNWNGRAWVN